MLIVVIIIVFLLLIVNVIRLVFGYELIHFKSSSKTLRNFHDIQIGKPVIYLYPIEKQNIEVQLLFKGDITKSDPAYDYEIQGWSVIAYPDGKLISKDQKTYQYLFWEGTLKHLNYDKSKGFVVKGKNTRTFLQLTLNRMGLNQKESEEFIHFWEPKMRNNKFNLIHFISKEYTDIAQLKITPQPDSVLRVFMVYQPLTSEIIIMPQEIATFERKGFSVIEWGGTEIVKN